MAALVVFSLRPAPASATATPFAGYLARSRDASTWYGSYSIGSVGTVWTLSPNRPAPDASVAWAPAPGIARAYPARTAMAWLVGADGTGSDAADHAAIMLALHDLAGARTADARSDLDRLTTDELKGFPGPAAEVLRRARAMKAEALAHGHLQGPARLTLRAAAGRDAALVAVSLTDAAGQPIAGIPVEVAMRDARSDRVAGITGADGSWRTALSATPGRELMATASIPRLEPDVWVAGSADGSPVVRPALDLLRATTTFHRAAAPADPYPPPTTPTTATTVGAPPTTSTSLPAPPATSTTLPDAPSSTSTTVAPTVTTRPAVAPASPSTTSTSAPPPVPGSPVLGATPLPVSAPSYSVSDAGTLPRTGVDSLTVALLGLGLVLLGSAALDAARGHAQPSAPSDRIAAMRSSS